MMKKYIALIFILSSAVLSQAQFALKVTPFTLTRNMKYTIHGEAPLLGSDRVSACLGISPNLVPKSIGLASDSINGYYYSPDLSQSWKGFSLDPEIRFYSRKLMEGFYVGGYSSFRFSSSTLLEYTDRDTSANYSNPTGGSQKLSTRVSIYGITIGYQKVYGKSDGFLLDVYGGFGKKFTRRSFDHGDQIHSPGYQDETTTGVALRLNVSIGYFFGRKETKTPSP